MAGSNRVTLSDIADRLNLTKVSVSKALRDHPDISAQTKKQVRETAQEMDYRHNRLAQSLTLNKTYTIGVIIPKISHTFFSDVLDGVNQVASENDYEIILCVSEEDEAREKMHLRTLMSMQVDGLLVSVSEQTDDIEAFREFEENDVPLVFFDRGPEGVEASRVTVDDRGGAYKAVTHAVQSGRERIAHLAGYSHVPIGKERRIGYENALRDQGLEVNDDWIVEEGFGEKDGYLGCKRLLERGIVPDAIFAVTFPVALGADDRIRQVNPSLREDIQIYSFGQHGLNRFFRHPHISIYQPTKELGRKAMNLLLEEIDDPDLGPREVELPTHVVDEEEIYNIPYLEKEPAQ